MNGLHIVEFMFYTHTRGSRFDSWMHRIDHYVGNVVATILPQLAKGIVVIAQPSSPRRDDIVAKDFSGADRAPV